MKKIYIAIGFAFVISTTKAQNKETKVADQLFNRYEFVDAAKEYLKINDKGKADAYVFKQLGDCYYNVFNSVEAEKWYAQATASQQDAETYFRYAEMLKANGKYPEANAAMSKFASLAPNDQRAQKSGNKNQLNEILGQSKKFDVKAVPTSSKYSDFGAFLKDQTVYFASARNTSRKTYDWNDQPYLDIYKADFVDGQLNAIATPVTEINSSYHEGPVTISADGNTMYFSRESFFDKKFVKSADKKTKQGKVNIFKATNVDGKWSNITPVSFNSKEFNTSSPSLSKDGSTLYFISDMPGSIGKTDVWKVSVNSDGTFGTPENLGSKVNTEGNELSAFIADNNTLYFSSNGLGGLGGLDVYAFDVTKGSEPINLGKPVNSEKDDFGFTFNQDKNIAFLSSNRDGGAGDDDIYLAIPVCNTDLIVNVNDAKSGAAVAEAKVSVFGGSQNGLANGLSNEIGKANFQFECEQAKTVTVSRNGYYDETVTVPQQKGEVALNVSLKPIEAIVTETEVILNNIYFDYNKSNITQQGASELDKLVAVMNQYPEMVIFAKSHTDSRGNDKYNMSLSDRRAKSTVQYVISKGIAKERITGQGFGESEPKVLCGDNCTEEEYAQNRRSEFMIVKK